MKTNNQSESFKNNLNYQPELKNALMKMCNEKIQ